MRTGITDTVDTFVSTAAYETGDFVLSGGFILGGTANQQAAIAVTSQPVFDLSGWTASGVSSLGGQTNNRGSLTGVAVCFDNSPPH